MTGLHLPAPPSLDAPWWGRHAHVQTVLGDQLPSPSPRTLGESIRVRLEDGDVLAGRTWAGTTDTVVLLFHGLGGSHDATYMNRAVVLSIARGHSIWAMNHRGCGEGRSLAKGTYHSGRADDIGAVIKAARQAHPGKRIAVIGFSLSGNALLLNLGDGIGVFEKPDVAIAVNPPIDLARCAVRLKTGFNRIYDLRFVIRCRRSVRERVEDGLIQDIYRIPRFCTLMDFDEFYTAPASGFRDRDDYYERCSAGPHLTNIQTPTVILMAEDDPFVAVESFREFKVSDSVRLHIESTGGHMGYLSKGNPSRRWLDMALGHYLDALLPHESWVRGEKCNRE